MSCTEVCTQLVSTKQGSVLFSILLSEMAFTSVATPTFYKAQGLCGKDVVKESRNIK